ncbi:MAG: hypothetical protein ACRCXT_00390 [Paraclostridium sp.]|uniref:hypothetical protein n=1 Tax=Cetobacterium sp. TaxID=2071632 RepID=UPI003F3CE866
MISKGALSFGLVGFLTIALIIMTVLILGVIRRSGLEMLETLGIIKYKYKTDELRIIYEEIIFRGKSIERSFSIKFILFSLLGIISFFFVMLMLFGICMLIGEYTIILRDKFIG